MATFIDTGLPGLMQIDPDVFSDSRGLFFETYRKSWFHSLAPQIDFVQHNHSSSHLGVLRGLHYQITRPQAKLIRVTSGKIWDVAVDIRRDSKSFGKWFGTELSAENHRMVYVTRGFAHGFIVLSRKAEIHYLCSDYYAPHLERGIAWNCPRLAIAWPSPIPGKPILSPKDEILPILDNIAPEDLPTIASCPINSNGDQPSCEY